MEVKPYNDQENKKEQVSRMFDNIAHRYDLLNRFLSLGIDKIWRKKALQQLSGHTIHRLLDVATGTADLAIAAAQTLKPKKITGIDISKEMLRFGQKKIKTKSLDKTIDLQHGDSENLPFEDNTFDAITVAFGVRNFENLEKGLAEMLRVLKKDGKVVILEFSKPTVFPLKQLFSVYFRYILPQIGQLGSKDPKAYQYLHDSVQQFPEGDEFLTILSKTGYQSSQCIRLSFGICSIYTGTK